MKKCLNVPLSMKKFIMAARMQQVLMNLECLNVPNAYGNILIKHVFTKSCTNVLTFIH